LDVLDVLLALEFTYLVLCGVVLTGVGIVKRKVVTVAAAYPCDEEIRVVD